MSEQDNEGTATSPDSQEEAKVAEQRASIAEIVGDEVENDPEDTQESESAESVEEQKKAKKPSMFDTMISAKKEAREYRRLLSDEVIPTSKALQEEVKSLKSGGSVEKDELEEVAEKYGIEPAVVKDLARAITSKTTKEVEDKYLSKFEAEQQERAQQGRLARVKAAVDKEFSRVIKENPQYEKIANREAVTDLILSNPKLQKKPLDEVVDMLYGKAVKDGAPMEGYSGRGGNASQDINYSNPKADDWQAISEKTQKTGRVPEEYANDLLKRLNAATGVRI